MNAGSIMLTLHNGLDLLIAALHSLRWTDVLDIIVVAFIFYSVYRLIQETRAIRIVYGFFVLASLYLISRSLDLTALKFLLESAFTMIAIAVPVVFQPELRAALERIGRGELMYSFWSLSHDKSLNIASDLTRTMQVLSEQKIGALIVIERRTGLRDIAATGVQIDAICTPETLVTIFFPKSPLHDGAVVIRGDRIVAASVFLPLTDDAEDISLGTRHRAALGISKQADAIVLVVSEETGRVSLVVNGVLEKVSINQLERRLRVLLAHRREKI